jgi:phosphatidylglycerophosphatase A
MPSLAKRGLRAIVLALASGAFVSYIPAWMMKHRRLTGAGLVGTFWGVVFLNKLPLEAGPSFIVWLAVVAISIAVSDAAEEYLGVKDDPRIVIDEFIGYWTAVLFLPRSSFVMVGAFVLFRIFDSWKPLGIARLGQLRGGWGIVLDDLAAGVAANLCLQLIRLVLPV